MTPARPYAGPLECLPVEEWAVRFRCSADHFKKIYTGRVIHFGSNLRIYAADLHEWLDAQGAEDANVDSWNGVGDAGARTSLGDAKEGAFSRRATR